MKDKLNALISVYDKSNLDKIAAYLNTLNCNIISTGGTYKYLRKLNLNLHNDRGLGHWIDYILTRNTINPKPDERLLNLIDEMAIKYPNQDSIRLKGLKRMVEIGSKYLSLIHI